MHTGVLCFSSLVLLLQLNSDNNTPHPDILCGHLYWLTHKQASWCLNQPAILEATEQAMAHSLLVVPLNPNDLSEP